MYMYMVQGWRCTGRDSASLERDSAALSFRLSGENPDVHVCHNSMFLLPSGWAMQRRISEMHPSKRVVSRTPLSSTLRPWPYVLCQLAPDKASTTGDLSSPSSQHCTRSLETLLWHQSCAACANHWLLWVYAFALHFHVQCTYM